METLIVAIFFVIALVIGAESRQVDPDRSLAVEVGLTGEQAVADTSPVRICDTDHHSIIQRDLTVSVDQQVSEDGH